MKFFAKATGRTGMSLGLFRVTLFLLLSMASFGRTASAHWRGTHFEMIKRAISILEKDLYRECPDYYRTYVNELRNNEIILKNAVRDVNGIGSPIKE
jgi:hypothetical protein